MSKRAGEFVTLDELVDEIGVDAARWFLLARSHDTTIELDLDLAREESPENNPVYYVQYAHARIAAILREAARRAARSRAALPAVTAAPVRARADPASCSPSRPRSPRRPTGARRTGSRPTRWSSPATSRRSTATARWSGRSTEDAEAFRLALCVATQRTLARSLDLLGVSAPESM